MEQDVIYQNKHAQFVMARADKYMSHLQVEKTGKLKRNMTEIFQKATKEKRFAHFGGKFYGTTSTKSRHHADLKKALKKKAE